MWISLAICLTAFECWAVFAPTGPIDSNNHPFLFPLVIGAFAVSGIGGWWMLLRILRKESRVFPRILLPMLVPNSFLWYYFEVVAPESAHD